MVSLKYLIYCPKLSNNRECILALDLDPETFDPSGLRNNHPTVFKHCKRNNHLNYTIKYVYFD